MTSLPAIAADVTLATAAAIADEELKRVELNVTPKATL
jgi:hypothetical protein